MKINRNPWKSLKIWGFYCLGCWKSIEILPGSLPAGLRSVQSSPAGLQISEISKIHENAGRQKICSSRWENEKNCFGLDAWFRSPWFHSMFNFEHFSNHHHRMHFLSSLLEAPRPDFLCGAYFEFREKTAQPFGPGKFRENCYFCPGIRGKTQPPHLVTL